MLFRNNNEQRSQRSSIYEQSSKRSMNNSIESHTIQTANSQVSIDKDKEDS
jgi:hypothetical protein